MATATETKLTAAAAYKQHVGTREAEIVDVIVPSGFTFRFEKPSRYSMLFHAGRLPQTAATQAVESWRAKGLIPDDMEVADEDAQNVQLAQTAFELRDKVLELSREPKLVVGEAVRENELSTDDVADEDLDYLFRWVSAGGDESLMLSRFPGRPQPNALASASRKKQRSKAK